MSGSCEWKILYRNKFYSFHCSKLFFSSFHFGSLTDNLWVNWTIGACNGMAAWLGHPFGQPFTPSTLYSFYPLLLPFKIWLPHWPPLWQPLWNSNNLANLFHPSRYPNPITDSTVNMWPVAQYFNLSILSLFKSSLFKINIWISHMYWQ